MQVLTIPLVIDSIMCRGEAGSDCQVIHKNLLLWRQVFNSGLTELILHKKQGNYKVRYTFMPITRKNGISRSTHCTVMR